MYLLAFPRVSTYNCRSVDPFCMSILFSWYRSYDDTQEVWMFVVFIKKTVCKHEDVQLWKKILSWVLSHDLYQENKIDKQKGSVGKAYLILVGIWVGCLLLGMKESIVNQGRRFAGLDNLPKSYLMVCNSLRSIMLSHHLNRYSHFIVFSNRFHLPVSIITNTYYYYYWNGECTNLMDKGHFSNFNGQRPFLNAYLVTFSQI